AAVDGVAAARGSIEAVTQLIKSDGTPTKTEGLGVAIGTNWIDDTRLNPFKLASGRAPTGDGEVVIDKATVTDEHWTLGTQVRVLTKAGATTLTLVGTATFDSLDSRPGSTLVATNDPTAERLFAEPNRFDRVVVAGANGVSRAELTQHLSTTISSPGSGLEAVTGEQAAADQQVGLKDQLRSFDRFLLGFAYVALFVGMFIV